MFVRKTFPEVLDQIADVEGWLTDEQARRLYDRASKLPNDAQIVEIGSFRGRSLIVLASAAPAGVGIVSIDPHAGGDRGPQEIAPNQQLGDSDYFCYTDNLTRAGVADRITHIRKMSAMRSVMLTGTLTFSTSTAPTASDRRAETSSLGAIRSLTVAPC